MGPQDNIQEEDDEEMEEDMVLAEVDSGDDSTVTLTVNQPTMKVSLQTLLCPVLLQAADLQEE